jgi:PAS domain S-box-containing protein
VTNQSLPDVIRLLVIDDDTRFADYLAVMLRRAPSTFAIDVAHTVEEGLHELLRATHHVCLLDYRLGVEDGLDVLRAAQARGLRTPIVLLTGDGNDSLEFTALEGGASDYLDKAEIDPRRLERMLRRAIARQRAETTLQHREARLADAEARALVMATQVALDGHWLKVTPRFCELLGYTEEELLALRFQDVTHPDDLARDYQCRQTLLDGATRSVEAVKRYVHKDGAIVWAYLNSSLVSGEDGAPLFFLTYVRDIGTQKRAEDALAASEQRYRSMVSNAPYGIFEATRDGRLLAVNPALVTMLAFDTEEEVVLFDPARLYGGSEERTRVLEQMARSGPSRGVETRWIRADGSPVLVCINAHLEAGGTGVIHGVVEDITERKRLEEQLRQAQKMEAIGQLAGGVAHDFNNLLTAILGYTDLLKHRCRDTPDICADLDEIKSAGASAASLTEQLLAFSRKQVLKPEVLSVNTVIERLQKLLPRLLGEDIEFVTRLGPRTPPVEADPVQLQQVILNLAVNARDAMPLGGRLVIATTEFTVRGRGSSSLAAGEYVLMTVQDNGCGMDSATQARIFEPFFTTKPTGKGTGLGLATVYGIIKQTGGEITCETQPGTGTTFSVFLPATTKAQRSVPGSLVPLVRGSASVLLVEDQPAVRRLTRRILESHGYDVVDTGDPDAAVHAAAGSRFDLLLTDVVMPQMSGPEVARGVRAHLPDIRVLYMSGFTGHSALSDISAAPFLSKPFGPAALMAKISEVLKADVAVHVASTRDSVGIA